MMRYEWKKLFESRLNVSAMLIGYLLIGMCVFMYISQESFYDKGTDSYIDGIEAFSLEQERAAGQTDRVTEEYVTQLVGKIQDYGMDMESDDAYREIIRPLGDIYYVVARNYADMRSDRIDENALMDIELTEGADFYGYRMGKIRDYLDMDFSYGNYKEAEKQYWIRKAGEVSVPFRWGSKAVMNVVKDTVSIGVYLWFVIVICASSVFASEHESGAALLLLTTKYGKDRLIRSKIGVMTLFTLGYLSTGILLAVGVTGLLLGFPGADLPVQLYNSVIPYKLTIGQMCACTFGIILLLGIAIGFLVLCCSARLRSSLAALVIGITVIIAPAFFPMSKESGLWNHINYLFPVRVADFKEMLESFVSYTVGDFVIPYVWMAVIVYVAAAIVALWAVRGGFVREK